jgi:hypothetical protein
MRSNNQFIVLDSNKAGVRFRTVKLENLNEQYSIKLANYDDTQKDFKDELMSVACELKNFIESEITIYSLVHF